MENVDLSKLSEESKDKIAKILLEDEQRKKEIRDEYLSGVAKIAQSDEYENMDYGLREGANVIYNPYGHTSYADKRKNGLLTNADKVTYRQLETIHESGTPANFINKIRNIVESRRRVDISEVDDVIDPKLLK